MRPLCRPADWGNADHRRRLPPRCAGRQRPHHDCCHYRYGCLLSYKCKASCGRTSSFRPSPVLQSAPLLLWCKRNLTFPDSRTPLLGLQESLAACLLQCRRPWCQVCALITWGANQQLVFGFRTRRLVLQLHFSVSLNAPAAAGLFCIMFGIIAAVGLSQMQYTGAPRVLHQSAYAICNAACQSFSVFKEFAVFDKCGLWSCGCWQLLLVMLTAAEPWALQTKIPPGTCSSSASASTVDVRLPSCVLCCCAHHCIAGLLPLLDDAHGAKVPPSSFALTASQIPECCSEHPILVHDLPDDE